MRQVVVAEDVARYAVRLVDASRPGRQSDHSFIREWVKWGAGPRAGRAEVATTLRLAQSQTVAAVVASLGNAGGVPFWLGVCVALARRL